MILSILLMAGGPLAPGSPRAINERTVPHRSAGGSRGGPTMKIKGLGGFCRETKGFQSLCLSIARAAAWDAGTLGRWNPGTLERWNPRKLGGWEAGKLAEHRATICTRPEFASQSRPVTGTGSSPEPHVMQTSIMVSKHCSNRAQT